MYNGRMSSEYINEVDKQGNRLGVIEKLTAHERGVLHEAFSIFVFNEVGELLLQKRQVTKYHSGGLWSNTCCSHARAGEVVADAAVRRLQEEMGFVCPLEFVGSFVYKAALDNNLTEHEFDYLFVGQSNEVPTPNPEEVSDYRWVTLEVLKSELNSHPEQYTAWLSIIMNNDDLCKKITNVVC